LSWGHLSGKAAVRPGGSSAVLGERTGENKQIHEQSS